MPRWGLARSWAGASRPPRPKKKEPRSLVCDKIEAGEDGEREKGQGREREEREWGGRQTEPPRLPGLAGRRLLTSHRRAAQGLQSRAAEITAGRDSKGGRGDQGERWRCEETETDRQTGGNDRDTERKWGRRRARFETQEKGEGERDGERQRRRQKDDAQMRQRGERQPKAGDRDGCQSSQTG